MGSLDEDDINAIAHRVVELLRPLLADTTGQGSEPEPHGTTSSRALADWLRDTHPGVEAALNTSLEEWSTALVEAAAGTDAVAALEWAWSPNCPTPYWRECHRPVAQPARRGGDHTRRADGGYRYGPWLQLLAEYRLSSGPKAAHLDEVDAVVAALVDAVNAAGHQRCAATVTSRKNALSILGDGDDTAETIVQIVRWCLAAKPHWRANLKGVPRPSTFRSMRGDWMAAGHGFSLENITDDALREQVRELAEGWSWYLSRALDRHVEVTARTPSRLHSALTGADGEPALTCEDIKATVLWMCDPEAGRLRYYTDGLDFPRPDKARKALLDMRSGPRAGGGVAGTNAAAADQAGDYADDDLRGTL
ncbi:hypothetical protein [Dietzia sp. 179-F 9C3 NHS]|uniref:hypothetical protein n=1 Tax=Dietzia sp. 179-F 9C3 NHS TaxID=3374295 RepID=UPI0038795421